VTIRDSERVAAAGIESVGQECGYSCDNALADLVRGLFKRELLRRGP
jgi:hypothetical protein